MARFIRLAVLAMSIWRGAAAAAPEQPPNPELALFSALSATPGVTHARVSPDGKRIAVIKFEGGISRACWPG